MSALIFWIDKKKSDIIPLTSIPKKDQREDAVIKLKFSGRKNSKFYRAKILKIAKSCKDLESYGVTIAGNLIEPQRREFTTEVKEQKKKSQAVNRQIKKSIQESDHRMTQDVLNTKSLFASDRRQNQCLSPGGSSTGQVSSQKGKTASGIRIQSIEVMRAPQQQVHAMDHMTNDANDVKNSTRGEDTVREDPATLPNFYPPVTREFLELAKLWLQFLEKRYEENMKHDPPVSERTEICDSLKIPGQDKTELVPGCSVYISTSALNDIKFRYAHQNQWRKLVTELLVEIYGKTLRTRTARGTRGTTAIDKCVFLAIFDFLNLHSTDKISLGEYTKLVNNVCSNRKRPAQKNSEKGSNKKVKRTMEKKDSDGSEQQSNHDDTNEQPSKSLP